MLSLSKHGVGFFNGLLGSAGRRPHRWAAEATEDDLTGTSVACARHAGASTNNSLTQICHA